MSGKIYPIKKINPKESRYGKRNKLSRTNTNIHIISRKKKSRVNDDTVRPFTIDTNELNNEHKNEYKNEHTNEICKHQSVPSGKKSPITTMRESRKMINDHKLKYKNNTMTQLTQLQNKMEILKHDKSTIKDQINNINLKIENITKEYNKNCQEEEQIDDGNGLFSCCLII
jgi:hypothetical protein